MTMFNMIFDLYEDMVTVDLAISRLCDMLDLLEKECMHRGIDKPLTTELFIRINGLKQAAKKMEAESKRIIRRADIDRYGPFDELTS